MPPRTTLEGTGAGVSPAHQPELAQADTGHLLRVAGAPAGCPQGGYRRPPAPPRQGGPWRPALAIAPLTLRNSQGQGPWPGPPALTG